MQWIIKSIRDDGSELEFHVERSGHQIFEKDGRRVYRHVFDCTADEHVDLLAGIDDTPCPMCHGDHDEDADRRIRAFKSMLRNAGLYPLFAVNSERKRKC